MCGATYLISTFLLLVTVSSQRLTVPADDRSNLEHFYWTCSGPLWFKSTNWLTSQSICTWYGITCDPELQQITVIDLMNNNLYGNVSAIGLHRFPKLEKLLLDSNFLIGGLPDVSRLQNLREFSLADNHLGGLLPLTLPSTLESVILNRCALEGPIPEWKDMTKLRILRLYGNRLSGTVPAFSSMLSLVELDIGLNPFEGPLPEFRNNLKLEAFLLGFGRMRGAFPCYSHLTSLKFLLVRFHDLTKGPRPGCLPASLSTLWIQNNKLNTSLDFLDTLPNLAEFDGSYNPWSQNIPPRLLKRLVSFTCRGCGFEGQIPAVWGNASSLRVLDLTENRIALPLPALKQLTILRLSSNPFNSDLLTIIRPIWDADHPAPCSLQRLELSNVSMTGSIPVFMFSHDRTSVFLQLTHLMMSRNPMLHGLLPPVLAWNAPLLVFDVSYCGLDGDIPASMNRFLQMELFNAQGTKLQSYDGIFPSFMRLSTTSFLVDGTGGFRCPLFTGFVTQTSTVRLDPSFYSFTKCLCIDNHFGVNAKCQRCPDACSCDADRMQDCFPSATAIVPCRTLRNDESICNPSMIAWNFSSSMPATEWCRRGHTGRLCAACQRGFYHTSEGECVECPNALDSMAVVLSQAVATTLAIGFLYFRTRPEGRNVAHGLPTASFKILVFHTQLLSALANLPSARLPGAFTALFATAARGSLRVDDLSALNCLANWPYYLRLLYSFFANPLVITICLLCFFLPTSRNYRIIGVLVQMLDLLYFGVSFAMLTPVGCTDNREPGITYLNILSAQACDAQWRATILPTAAMGILLWIVCLPIAVVAVAGFFKRNLPEEKFMLAFGVLSDDYQADYSYWNLMLLLRRLCVALTVTIVPYHGAYQSLMFFTILQASALTQQRFSPFRHPLDNRAELISLYLNLGNFFTCVVASTLLEGSAVSLEPWIWVLLTLNIAFLVFLVINVLRPPLRKCMGAPAAPPSVPTRTTSKAISLTPLYQPLLDD